MSKIVITGANRGIGLAMTRRFLNAGDEVLALCRAPDGASDLQALAREAGGRLSIGQIDISDEASIVRAAANVGPVDVLINNAGIIGGEDQSLETIDIDAWMNAFKVMAIGPFLVTRAFLPGLKQAKGKVVFISSQLAATAWPYGGYYSYSSAKAAGNRVVHSLALDLKDDGVTLISVHPGYVQTDMGGPNAEIRPEDSAEGIYRLVSNLKPEASGGFFKWNGEPHPL
jgi:NAD(P)-dependent dehydrogenase (short-subunit alcohol dehydrogenase family)